MPKKIGHCFKALWDKDSSQNRNFLFKGARWSYEQSVQRVVKQAIQQAGGIKHGGCYTFVTGFATHLLEDGYDIRTVQELLGCKDVKIMMYLHAYPESEWA